jgi:ATP-dependent Clp protease ATP-binding subunit ClpA
VGFDQGGLLTESVRKTPYAVLLLDEIEKAHQDIYDILLQIMDYATLTDNSGRKADFRHVILIMTSNAGARDISARPVGFVEAGAGDAARRAGRAVEETFSPEFRNRLDALVPFHNLSADLMDRIVDIQLRDLLASLAAKQVKLTLTPAAREWLAAEGYDPALGARPLHRLLREALEDPLAEEILFGRLAEGGEIEADAPLTGRRLRLAVAPAGAAARRP